MKSFECVFLVFVVLFFQLLDDIGMIMVCVDMEKFCMIKDLDWGMSSFCYVVECSFYEFEMDDNFFS